MSSGSSGPPFDQPRPVVDVGQSIDSFAFVSPFFPWKAGFGPGGRATDPCCPRIFVVEDIWTRCMPGTTSPSFRTSDRLPRASRRTRRRRRFRRCQSVHGVVHRQLAGSCPRGAWRTHVDGLARKTWYAALSRGSVDGAEATRSAPRCRRGRGDRWRSRGFRFPPIVAGSSG